MLRRGIQSLNELNALNNLNFEKLNQEVIVVFSVNNLFRKLSLKF